MWPVQRHHGPLLPSRPSPAGAPAAAPPPPPPPFCLPCLPVVADAGCWMPARDRASRTPRAPKAGRARGLGRSPGALSWSAADAAAAAAAIARSLADVTRCSAAGAAALCEPPCTSMIITVHATHDHLTKPRSAHSHLPIFPSTISPTHLACHRQQLPVKKHQAPAQRMESSTSSAQPDCGVQHPQTAVRMPCMS